MLVNKETGVRSRKPEANPRLCGEGAPGFPAWRFTALRKRTAGALLLAIAAPWLGAQGPTGAPVAPRVGAQVSLRFDFIIIHESAHEWFGNAVTAADPSDMRIHEGWATYLEGLYVEYMYGKDDAIKYLNGYQSKVRNRQPIVGQRGINREPPQDQYFKGALFLNTLRSVVNDDKRWWALLHGFFQHFKYRNIMTEDVAAYFNEKTGMNLTPIFDQYLRHTDLPTLELKFDDPNGKVSYRWKAGEPAFTMPVRAGLKDHWQILQPTTEWKELKTPLKKDEFAVATDLYFVNVRKE